MKLKAILFSLLIVMALAMWANQNMYDENGNLPRNYSTKFEETKLEQVGLETDDLRNIWQGVGPWGGDVTSISICPETPSTLYAALGNPYISTDSGQTWNVWETLALQSSNIFVIATAPGGIIYAGGGYNDDVLKSTDGGETWTQLTNFPISLRDIRVITIDPIDSDIIYVGVAGNSAATTWTQIAKSINGGSNWSVLNTNALGITMGITDIAIDPSNTQNVVVSGEGGISGGDAVYSNDGGTSWQNISSGLPTQYPFNDIEISGTDVFLAGGQLFGGQHVGVYKAQMGVFSWQNISTSFPLPVVNEVLVSPDNNLLIYAATEGDGIYKSLDGGNTWEFSTTGADNFSIFDLMMNPVDSQELYIGCKSMAVYKSGDSGSSWDSANVGIAVLWINDIAVDPTNPDNIIVGFEAENSGGCYISHDGGVTWDVVESLPATRFSAVAFDLLGNVFACSQGPTTVAPEGVYRSIDGGSSWNNTGPNLGPNFETQLWDIEISETDPNLIFISGNHFGNGGWAATVYRTHDSGTSDWVEVYIGPDNYQVHAIELAPNSSDQILYAGYTNYDVTGSFMRSTDQGNTWVNINNGIPTDCRQCYSIAVDPINPLLVYAGTGYYSAGFHIMKTEDGGDNWNSLYTTSSTVNGLIIDPDNANHLYAAVQNSGVVMSNNGGQAWQDASEGITYGSQMSRFSNSYEDGNETKFYVGTYNRSAFKNTMEIAAGFNPPNNVAIEVVGFNDNHLTWEEPDLTSAILTGYKIYRDGTVIIEIADPNTMEFLDIGLDEGVYEYYMTAVYTEGESDQVGFGNVTITLPAPINVQAWSSWPNIIVQWAIPNANRAIESYNIYRDDEFLINLVGTFYIDPDVAAGDYVYNVACLFSGGYEGPWSDDVLVEGHGTDTGQNLVNLVTSLDGNYPNPFNPSTTISFGIKENEEVILSIYNIRGQCILKETFEAGNHQYHWNAKGFASGVYFYKLSSPTTNITKKMLLME